jgi:cell division topological specificity factor
MRNILRLFGRGASAPVAHERLKILLQHERRSAAPSQELIARLHRDVLEAIARHIAIDPDKVDIDVRHRDSVSLLEINLEIPDLAALSAKAQGAKAA